MPGFEHSFSVRVLDENGKKKDVGVSLTGNVISVVKELEGRGFKVEDPLYFVLNNDKYDIEVQFIKHQILKFLNSVLRGKGMKAVDVKYIVPATLKIRYKDTKDYVIFVNGYIIGFTTQSGSLVNRFIPAKTTINKFSEIGLSFSVVLGFSDSLVPKDSARTMHYLTPSMRKPKMLKGFLLPVPGKEIMIALEDPVTPLSDSIVGIRILSRTTRVEKHSDGKPKVVVKIEEIKGRKEKGIMTYKTREYAYSFIISAYNSVDFGREVKRDVMFGKAVAVNIDQLYAGRVKLVHTVFLATAKKHYVLAMSPNVAEVLTKVFLEEIRKLATGKRKYLVTNMNSLRVFENAGDRIVARGYDVTYAPLVIRDKIVKPTNGCVHGSCIDFLIMGKNPVIVRKLCATHLGNKFEFLPRKGSYYVAVGYFSVTNPSGTSNVWTALARIRPDTVSVSKTKLTVRPTVKIEDIENADAETLVKKVKLFGIHKVLVADGDRVAVKRVEELTPASLKVLLKYASGYSYGYHLILSGRKGECSAFAVHKNLDVIIDPSATKEEYTFGKKNFGVEPGVFTEDTKFLPAKVRQILDAYERFTSSRVVKVAVTEDGSVVAVLKRDKKPFVIMETSTTIDSYYSFNINHIKRRSKMLVEKLSKLPAGKTIIASALTHNIQEAVFWEKDGEYVVIGDGLTIIKTSVFKFPFQKALSKIRSLKNLKRLLAVVLSKFPDKMVAIVTAPYGDTVTSEHINVRDFSIEGRLVVCCDLEKFTREDARKLKEKLTTGKTVLLETRELYETRPCDEDDWVVNYEECEETGEVGYVIEYKTYSVH